MKCKKPFCRNEARQKYCSSKCANQHYYLMYTEKYKKQAKEWGLNNPERKKEQCKRAFEKWLANNPEKINELMRKYYNTNKDKHFCRHKTKLYLRKKTRIVSLNKACLICGSTKRLEIHHEQYSINMKVIERLIINRKIYFVCFEHHRSFNKTNGGKNGKQSNSSSSNLC